MGSGQHPSEYSSLDAQHQRDHTTVVRAGPSGAPSSTGADDRRRRVRVQPGPYGGGRSKPAGLRHTWLEPPGHPPLGLLECVSGDALGLRVVHRPWPDRSDADDRQPLSARLQRAVSWSLAAHATPWRLASQPRSASCRPVSTRFTSKTYRDACNPSYREEKFYFYIQGQANQPTPHADADCDPDITAVTNTFTDANTAAASGAKRGVYGQHPLDARP